MIGAGMQSASSQADTVQSMPALPQGSGSQLLCLINDLKGAEAKDWRSGSQSAWWNVKGRKHSATLIEGKLHDGIYKGEQGSCGCTRPPPHASVIPDPRLHSLHRLSGTGPRRASLASWCGAPPTSR